MYGGTHALLPHVQSPTGVLVNPVHKSNVDHGVKKLVVFTSVAPLLAEERPYGRGRAVNGHLWTGESEQREIHKTVVTAALPYFNYYIM